MAIEGLFYVRIHVSDIVRAKRFYGKTLGWKLHTDEPDVGGFWFGSGYLIAMQDPRAASERRDPTSMNVTVKVSDIDAEHAQLGERGVAVSSIESRPWGQRDFRFTDPDGYLWEYAQQSG